MARIHVVVGSILFALSLNAQQLPKVLPLAQGGAWRTDLILQAKPGVNAPVDFPLGFGEVRHVQPNGAIILQDAGLLLATEPFATTPAPADLDAVALLKFDDGVTANSYAVGPIGAVQDGYPSRIGPIVNGTAEKTYLNFFAKHVSVVSLAFYDGTNIFVPHRETIEINSAVSQYQVQTEIPIGFVTITTGAFGFTSSAEPVYCFASVTTPRGGNARILPCGE